MATNKSGLNDSEAECVCDISCPMENCDKMLKCHYKTYKTTTKYTQKFAAGDNRKPAWYFQNFSSHFNKSHLPAKKQNPTGKE